MNFFSSVFAILFIISVTNCQPYTYWISSSCSDDRYPPWFFSEGLDDALAWARRGAERLESNNAIQRTYFSRLFAEETDPQYHEKVRNVTGKPLSLNLPL